MDIKSFLTTVCNQIKYKPIRENISEELKGHIEEAKEEFISKGMDPQKAEEKAVAGMGEAEDIGKKLNKVHKPKLDWELLILIIILIGFGLVVAILHEQNEINSKIENTIFYIIIGSILGIAIYFFDYRKMKKYSNTIYLIATIIMFMPFTGMCTKVNGVNQISIFGIVFNPCTVTVPLYLIAFIGYIVNYNKENIINIQIQDEKFKINKDFWKILILSVVSLILMVNIPSIVNAAMLGLAYMIITTMKIIQEDEDKVKKLIALYGIPLIMGVIFIIIIDGGIYLYRFQRIITSFNPEIDPQGSGYVGMLQKEVLKNSKFIGEADTEIITTDKYIIGIDSNYTFIYLLRKNRSVICWNIGFNNYISFYKINFKCKKHKR